MNSSRETLKGGFACPKRHKKKSLLHLIVTGDEKWIHYDNPKRKKSYVKPGQPAKINGKAEYPWREGNSLYLVRSEGCAVLWAAKTGWNHQWRTLPNTINPFEERNSRKTPGICDQTWGNNFSSWQRSVPCCYSGLELFGKQWPYSPELAPSDYHFFRSMQNTLTGIRFSSEQGIKNWIDSFLAAKPAQFFWDGIHKLPER